MKNYLSFDTDYLQYIQPPKKKRPVPEFPLIPFSSTVPAEMKVPIFDYFDWKPAKTPLSALSAVSYNHADIVSAWLNNRQPGEQNIRVDTAVEYRRCSCCGETERIRATTRVSIW